MVKKLKTPVSRELTCAWRIPNHRSQSAPPRDLIFPSTMLTLSSHEEYVHGFHLPLVRDSQRVQDGRHEGLDCGKPPAEVTAVGIVNLTDFWQTGGMKHKTPSYQRHRFPSEIISHAVWLYHRSASVFVRWKNFSPNEASP